jgi:hypothetical protein
MLCVINRYIRGALRKISGEYNTIRQKVGRVMPAVSHKDWNRSTLGGRLKTGHLWTLQNRPMEPNQNKSIYTLQEVIRANIFSRVRAPGFILASPGRRIQQRRDATRAPIQRPEWWGGASRPFGNILAQKR